MVPHPLEVKTFIIIIIILFIFKKVVAVSLLGFRFSMSVLLYVYFGGFVCRSLGESKWRALFATIISKCENYCTSNTPLSERGEKRRKRTRSC